MAVVIYDFRLVQEGVLFGGGGVAVVMISGWYRRVLCLVDGSSYL